MTATQKTRARLALQGLSIGDAFGERFFFSPHLVETLIAQRAEPQPPWPVTDDTIMALSIVENLERFGAIEQDALAAAFAAKYRRDPGRGYGATAHHILREIGDGMPWKTVSESAFGGTGSMGNGGAMRVAPLGAFFAEDLGLVAQQAQRSAQVTHAHAEGQAGAIAIAVASAHAAVGGTVNGLFDVVLKHTPDSETRRAIERAQIQPASDDVRDAVRVLGNGGGVIAQDTVPFCLWCAAQHWGNYEEALWKTVSGLGDRDTTCAIVGGIIALSDGGQSIPTEWLNNRESLGTFQGIS